MFADFGKYLVHLVAPMYAGDDNKVKDVDKEIFALDSTTTSVSIVLIEWAKGKYSRGAVKMHTVLDLRGNIPTFINITDGKYHDVNALDEIETSPGAMYIMYKAYIDFSRLYKLHKYNAFFIVRAKSNLRFKAVPSTKVDKADGLRCDQKIKIARSEEPKTIP